MEKIKQLKSRVEYEIKNAKILDKYIFMQLLEVFLFGVVVFTSLIFASETFTVIIRKISEYGIPLNIALMMIVLNLPQIFVLSIPISTLFAVVMTINKLSLNSEITVLKACGIGIDRIAKPVFAFAILMTVLSLFINNFIVPSTSKQSQLLTIYSLQQKHIPEGKKNYTLRDSQRIFYVQECIDKTLLNVTVLDLSNKDTIQLIQAKKGQTDAIGWIFKDAVLYTISTTGKLFNTAVSDEFVVNFGLDNMNFEKLLKGDASQYDYFKLFKFIMKNKGQAHFPIEMERKYRVELHDKVALPMTTMVLALVGIPLAITPPRVRYNRGFLFSILIIFLFYVIRAFCINLGETGTLTPLFAAWLPVIIIFSIGYILYKRKAYNI